MWTNDDPSKWPSSDNLSPAELARSIGAAAVLDPGEDETSDPDDFPWKEPEPPGDGDEPRQ